jgi:hypothetical protein
MYLHGMPVIESSNLISGYKTIPKKRNKNKRIQKKWNKKYGYYFVPIPDTNIYYFDGMYGGHPKTIKKIMKIIKKEEEQCLK